MGGIECGTLGYDFHPTVFFKNFHEYFVSEELETILRVQAGRTEVKRADGILVVDHYYKGNDYGYNYEYAYVISLDTKKGFRPVHWELSEVYPDTPERSEYTKRAIEWVQYEGVWYPESAEHQRTWHSKKEDGTIEEHSERIKVRITEFDPHAEVSYADFTLAGINVPFGIRVEDTIADIVYNYDAWDIPEIEPEHAAGAESVVTAQAETNHPDQQAVWPETTGTHLLQETSDVETQRKGPFFPLVLIVAAAGGIFSFLWVRRMASRS